MVQSFNPARPCQQMLAELRNKFPNPGAVKVQLECDTIVNGSNHDIHCCQICLCIVWGAKYCSSCEKLFCADCIDPWLRTNPSCPSCRAKCDAKKLPRFGMQVLETLKFKCSSCQQIHDYNQAGQHQSRCQAVKIACLLVCDPQPLYQDWNQMEDHLVNLCPRFKHICDTCNDAKYRAQPHNCVQGLLRNLS